MVKMREETSQGTCTQISFSQSFGCTVLYKLLHTLFINKESNMLMLTSLS